MANLTSRASLRSLPADFPYIYSALVAVMCLVALGPTQISSQSTPDPPSPQASPVPAASNLTDCSTQLSCWGCAAAPNCAWCLAKSGCFDTSALPDECRFTAYTDCCVTLGSCTPCVADVRCGFCSDTKVKGCMSGAFNGSADQSCPLPQWAYSKCPDQTDVPGGFVLGIVLVLGGGLVIISTILLVIFIRRYYRQKDAQAAIAKHYRRLQLKTCEICQDGVALWRCKECQKDMCDHCVVARTDTHKKDHTLTPLDSRQGVSRGTIDVKESRSATAQGPLLVNEGAPPGGGEEGQDDPTFASLVAQRNSNHRSYNSMDSIPSN